MDARAVERALLGRSYQEIEAELAGVENSMLLALLDSTSSKVGDVAAEQLGNRKQPDAVIAAVAKGDILTKRGKIRAMSVLHRFGRKCGGASNCYRVLVSDKSVDVVDSALFGLVFMRDRQGITVIENAMSSVSKNGRLYELYGRAINALEKQDPFLYSPSYEDMSNVWELRETKGDADISSDARPRS